MTSSDFRTTILEALALAADRATDGREAEYQEALGVLRNQQSFQPESLAVQCQSITIGSDSVLAYRADIRINGQSLTEMNWRSFRLEGRIPGPITLTMEYLPRHPAP